MRPASGLPAWTASHLQYKDYGRNYKPSNSKVKFQNYPLGENIMSIEKAVEAIIKEAQERGDFDNLKGKGQPIDLDAYFETPEDLRLAYTALKNAGMVSPEVELLQEIAALKERLASTYEETQRNKLKKILHDKQLEFNIMMERQKKLLKG